MDSSDTFLTWACLWATLNKNLEITNIANQNIKECKRIDKWIKNYKYIGGESIKTKTGLSILKKRLYNNRIVLSSYNDHRMAMSWSLVLYKYNNLLIKQPSCVNKTCPNYWKLMDFYFNTNSKYELLGYCKDIVLIGMPNSGKTHLGKIISDIWNIKQYDTDAILKQEFRNVYKINSIKDYINVYGWKDFRNF